MLEAFPQQSNSYTRREHWFALLLAASLTGVVLCRTHLLTDAHPAFALSIDHHKYLYMAQEPLTFHVAPFCWRILVPLLARALPFPLATNFLLISVVAVCLMGSGMVRLARNLGHTDTLAFSAASLLFTVGWATKFVLQDFWLPDALAFCLTVWAMVCLVERRTLAFVVLLTVGVCVKESVFFVGPLCFHFLPEELRGWRRWKRTLQMLLPAVLTIAALHGAIPARNSDAAYMASLPQQLRDVQPGLHSYAPGELFALNGAPRLQHVTLHDLSRYTLGTFGVLMVALPCLAARNRHVLWQFAPFLLLVYAQILFASNVERLAAAGFPVFILMAMNGLESVQKHFALPEWLLVLLPLPFVALILIDIDRKQAPLAVQGGLFCGLVVTLIGWHLLARKFPLNSKAARSDTSK